MFFVLSEKKEVYPWFFSAADGPLNSSFRAALATATVSGTFLATG